jgi:ATP-dependent exoDNAse (exonuclease V) beta subunit
LRRDDLIVKDVSPAVLRQRLDGYEQWRASRQAAVTAASIPSIDVVTATEYASDEGSAGQQSGVRVDVERAAVDEPRPGGVRFGTLVHAVLAAIPLSGGADEAAARLAEAHGRVLGAPPDEVSAAADAVRRVLRHPVLTAAARAAEQDRCYRETPVTLRLENGAIVEGNVDLAYVDEREVVVVDFKTDRELEGKVETYQRQVQVYAQAIGAALQRQARGVLMRV